MDDIGIHAPVRRCKAFYGVFVLVWQDLRVYVFDGIMGLVGLYQFVLILYIYSLFICIQIYRLSIYRQSIYNVVNRTCIDKIIILVITCLNKSININQIVRYLYLYLFKQIQNKYTPCTHKLQKLTKYNCLILQGFLGIPGQVYILIQVTYWQNAPIYSIHTSPSNPKINCTKITHNYKNHFGA